MPWEKKIEEMEIIQAMVGDQDHFTEIEAPSESEYGQFKVFIEPNCGMDLSGCNIEIQMTYMDLDSQENIRYEILEQTAVGLTDEQVSSLQLELEGMHASGLSSQEIVMHMQESLGRENQSSRFVI